LLDNGLTRRSSSALMTLQLRSHGPFMKTVPALLASVLLLTACTSSELKTPALTATQIEALDAGLAQISLDFGLMGLAVAYLLPLQQCRVGTRCERDRARC
jgi:hypothetical protein